ncbi:hypothetical protein EI94DRAFT_1731775 [Lactarius quietus]|nr:hypothetical protein EI94DRAFT_1731775 [Lactarius quietus]
MSGTYWSPRPGRDVATRADSRVDSASTPLSCASFRVRVTSPAFGWPSGERTICRETCLMYGRCISHCATAI